MKFYNTYIRITLLCLGGIFSSHIGAQEQTISPYSRFGIGDFASKDFQHLQMMGGIRGAFHDAYQTNLANPASLAFLNATAFEVGAYAKRNKLSEGDLDAINWTGNLSHISLSFPIFNPIADLLNREDRKLKWGMNLSLVPFTRVGYDTETVDSSQVEIGRLAYRFLGSGGSYKAQWANGFKYNNLAFGVKAFYMFGRSELDRTVIFQDINNANTNRFTNNFTYNGFGFELGAIYQIKLNAGQVERSEGKKPLKSLSLGAYWSPITQARTNTELFYRTVNINTPVNAVDTLLYTEEPIRGEARIPGNFGLGAFYTVGDKWRMGVNFEQQAWSQYANEATEEEEGVLKDAYELSFGASYRPDLNSFDNFWKRLSYKAGFRVGNDPRTINGEQINTLAISTGVTAPFFFQRQISFVDLGIEFGKRTVANGINENYTSILLGFTLNDNDWFIQRKFN